MQSESVLLKCANDTEVQGFKYHKGKKLMTLEGPIIEMELHAKA